MTSSGPFGVEDCIQAAGPRWTLPGFILVTLVYVLPEILMTSELTMMQPLSNGGVVSWTSRAFGSRAASCTALNMLLYQIVDLATYPTLALGYVQSMGYADHIGSLARFAGAAPFAVVFVGFGLNLLNIEVAGEVYLRVLIFIMLPFLVGMVFAAPFFPVAWEELAGSAEATVQPPSKDLNLFVSTMLWLNTGWDSMGNLASDVHSPSDLVRGLTLAAAATLVLYTLCTFAALGAGPGSWSGGYLAVAYGRFCAPLAPWICICAGLANSLLYTSELTAVARLIQSMGDPKDELRLLPTCFARQFSSGAPVIALLVVTIAECGLVTLTFDYLVQLSTFIHVIAFWMSLAAYVKLGVYRPDIVRLFTVPGGKWGLRGVFCLKAPVLLFLTLSACTNISVVLGGLGANAVFILLLFLWTRCHRRRPAENGPGDDLLARDS